MRSKRKAKITYYIQNKTCLLA